MKLISKQTYVQQDGDRCPHCGSEDIQAVDLTVGATLVLRDCSCFTCGIEFTERFTLSGYGNVWSTPDALEPIEPPDEEPDSSGG